MKDDEKNALIEHRIARATNTIEEVSFLIKNRKFLPAVNRIYYGMFYILSALSLKYDFSVGTDCKIRKQNQFLSVPGVFD